MMKQAIQATLYFALLPLASCLRADVNVGEETTGGESSTTEEASEASTEEMGVCGDGKVDEGEECDDGNIEDGDGCPSGAVGGCVAAGRCGDGIVWAGMEGCDDGNAVAGDGCEADCSETPVAECGNGVLEGNEECDDGNEEDEDGCVGECVLARCGDGFVWAGMEGCDDGNAEEEDECPSGAMGQCAAAGVCGDGFVWIGMEGCDDGNTSEEDECPSGAVGQCAAEGVCGDGFVWIGMEGCDDGNGVDLDGCNDDCAEPRWVFITSTNGPNNNGNLGGIGGADAHCQELAVAAGLGGTYMAWLTGSDPASAPATRFGSAGFAGWYLLPTEPPVGVARGWEDLVSPNVDVPENYLQAAILADEAGVVINNANIWTNTGVDAAQAVPSANCGDWQTDDFEQFGSAGLGTSDALGAGWTTNKHYECNVGARLYCFQVG
jgi:cysteine-rich repeat protein